MAMRDVLVYLEDIRIFIDDLNAIKLEAGTFSNYTNSSLYINASEMILIKLARQWLIFYAPSLQLILLMLEK